MVGSCTADEDLRGPGVSAYHVTPRRNLASIAEHGLRPGHGGMGGACEYSAREPLTRAADIDVFAKVSAALQRIQLSGGYREALLDEIYDENAVRYLRWNSRGKVHLTLDPLSVYEYVARLWPKSADPQQVPFVLEIRLRMPEAHRFHIDPDAARGCIFTRSPIAPDRLAVLVAPRCLGRRTPDGSEEAMRAPLTRFRGIDPMKLEPRWSIEELASRGSGAHRYGPFWTLLSERRPRAGTTGTLPHAGF
ncbi:hypothetical protein ACFQU1_17035 [Chelatococcus sp. GCM10030263]|uniref:hypothetical protein n=1 Tax=Chelatococcus sp. GCM10030263 TaxID=3273387 RepID=UPI00361B34E7